MYSKWCLVLFAVTSTVAIDSSSTQSSDVNTTDVVLFAPESAFKNVDNKDLQIFWYTNITEEIDRVEVKTENTFNSEVTSYSQPIVVLDEADLPEEINFNASTIEGQVTHYGEINLTTLFVGFNELQIHLFDKENNSLGIFRKEQIVLLEGQYLADIFSYSAAVIVGILYFFMGSTLDLQIVKGIFKKPIGPFLGVFCQYGVMPPVAYGLGLLFFPDKEDVALRLGLFLNGCCPGGGASNMWTHLLGGSLDLSIMMTSVSTILAFGTVPMWVLSVGPVIAKEGNFVIPFMEIVVTVIGLIFPCIIGIVVQIFFPRIIKISEKVLTPFSAFILVFIFTFGVYSYRYTFVIMTWKSILAGFLLPFLGYTLGIVLARLCRQSWKNAIAVAIETGVQNTTVTIIILAVAIKPPTSTLAAVIPVTNTLLTPLPLTVALVVRLIYQKKFASKKGKISSTSTTNLKEITSKSEENGKVDSEKKVDDTTARDGGVTNPAADLRDVV